MEIKKRDGRLEIYDRSKIEKAIQKAFDSQGEAYDETIAQDVENKILNVEQTWSVEQIQDVVEQTLMEHSFYAVAKAYILYRHTRMEARKMINEILSWIKNEAMEKPLWSIVDVYHYDVHPLYEKYRTFLKDGMTKEEAESLLVRACVELISKEQPNWEYVASRVLNVCLSQEVLSNRKHLGISSLYELMGYLTNVGLYGKYMLEGYTKEEVDELEAYIDLSRTDLLTYSGLDLLMNRYLICNHDHERLELVQDMFMGIAMHLALPEKDRVFWAKEIYDILSTLQVTMATPTMANARKPFHQMSSCFIDTVEDSLTGIYKSIDNFAQVSKHGGGMGMYFGKVRANGSDIRGFKGAAGGVIRWLKLVNDTAVAVDQLGVRQGAVAVYLDIWHKDVLEFLQIRTNNGDDRMKAHDIFPALCVPDLFWKMVKEDLDQDWYLMCPHEIKEVMGFALEDHYGASWEEKYWQCVQEPRLSKRKISLKELVRLFLRSAIETGTPFIFNRDIVNEANPNKHKGMIYCSNLCTEIAQNMKAMHVNENEIKIIDGQEVVVETITPGDFVVCNLASLTLGKIDVNDKEKLEHVISVVTRALDNVIDLNFYPIPYAKITNHKMRPIGLGTSGYHHRLVKEGLSFESQEHLDYMDALYEDISYYAIKASLALAKEKGHYELFEGSDWQNGSFFQRRGYDSDRWKELKDEVSKHGLRNGYLLAIAPTSSTSVIAATSACCDPIMNKFWLEEKKGAMMARVAPDLNAKTFWLYKNAHLIDQKWLIDAAGIRQRHIDQAQSVNLYITNEFTFRKVLDLYIRAFEKKVKTIYYVRSKSLEVEECESCSA